MPIAPEMVFLSDLLLPRDPVSARHASTKQYVDTGLSGKAAVSHTHCAAEVRDLGTAATKDWGTGAGQVPVLDGTGKLDSGLLPAIAITDVYSVNTQAAMLALSAQKGDVCIRTDESKTYILTTSDPTAIANWVVLATPTGSVISVAGRTGAITLSTSDISGLGTAATKDTGTGNGNVPVLNSDGKLVVSTTGSAATLGTSRTIALSGGATGTATGFDGSSNITIPVTALDATKVSGALPSSVTATTQNASDNSTKIATTAYVDRALSWTVY